MISSGTILAYQGERIQIKPFPAEEFSLTFVFEENEEKPDERDIRVEVASEKDSIWFLTNFLNAEGSATGAPVLFAEHEGRKLYLSFATYIIGTKEKHTRMFAYALALGAQNAAT